MGELALRIVTAKGAQAPVRCDGVHLTVCDGQNGRGGGSCGIRPGHIKAVFSLAENGKVTAWLAGTSVFTGRCGGGFATVDKDVVTVVTESFVPGDSGAQTAPDAAGPSPTEQNGL